MVVLCATIASYHRTPLLLYSITPLNATKKSHNHIEHLVHKIKKHRLCLLLWSRCGRYYILFFSQIAYPSMLKLWDTTTCRLAVIASFQVSAHPPVFQHIGANLVINGHIGSLSQKFPYFFVILKNKEIARCFCRQNTPLFETKTFASKKLPCLFRELYFLYSPYCLHFLFQIIWNNNRAQNIAVHII